MSDNAYRGRRFPRDVISYAVWFYYRFAVSFRDVEEAMASRGVLVSYETVRHRCDKFGHLFVAGLRKRRAQTGDKWQLDETIALWLHQNINDDGASFRPRGAHLHPLD